MQKLITRDLREVCSLLLKEHEETGIALRFPELINDKKLAEEEVVVLKEWFKWSKKQNCHEIIVGVVYELPRDEIKCVITNFPIYLHNALYRLYTVEEIQHRCFNPKIKKLSASKWSWELKTDYDFEEVEKICEHSTAHKILKCPMLINHCYNWIAKHNLDVNKICNPAEAYYLWKHKIARFPVCEITGEKLKFSGSCYSKLSKKGANILSSELHKNKVITEEQKQKTKQTNLTRYGVEYIVSSAKIHEKGLEVRRQNAAFRKLLREIKHKINPPLSKNEKYRQTMTERYGGPTMKSYLEKNPQTKESKKRATEKCKQTWLEKYGTNNPQQLSEVRNKTKQTNIEKYGYACYLNTPEQKKLRAHQDNIETYNNFSRFADYCTPMFSLSEWLANTKDSFKWKLTKTGEVYHARYWGYAPLGRFQHSSLERMIHELLKTWNCNFVTSDRQVISPRELDVFIPSARIAIECNGEFFHSDQRLGRNYHDEKRRECESANVQLLQFFGCEIKKRPKAVKSVIKNALKLNSYKIYARKTKVCNVSSSYARKFYEKYHIHGFCGASVHYGLSLNGKIVQMLSIGSARFEKNQNSKEVIRSATIYNFNVIGGLSKLVSAVRKDFPDYNIHTYVDLSCFSGKGYEASGFVYQNTTPPSYYYFKGDRYPIYSRYQTQKHKLKKLLGDRFDPSKTEQENMKLLGYCKVFRCSHKHYVIKS